MAAVVWQLYLYRPMRSVMIHATILFPFWLTARNTEVTISRDMQINVKGN